jgi:hypothetical protein
LACVPGESSANRKYPVGESLLHQVSETGFSVTSRETVRGSPKAGATLKQKPDGRPGIHFAAALQRPRGPGRFESFRVAASIALPPSRFSCSISVFPVIRYACLTENKPDQLGEARFRANIVREDQNTALARLDADHGVRCLAVVATFEKAVTLRAVEGDHS